LCSHLLSDVQDICDRVAILDKGRLQISGTIDELLSSKDVVEMLIRNLSDEAISEVETFVKEKHGEVISVKNSSDTLEGLFLKIYAANINNSKTDV
jgi:ABC-2 type transport system ATP-binding protein